MSETTAPVPVLVLLDQLTEARAKADGLPWHVDPQDDHRIADHVGAGVTCTFLPDDAVAIVAAMNAVPRLVAALRAVLALADEWDTEADDDDQWLRGPRVSVSEAQEYPATIQQSRRHVRDLRAVLASALTEEGQ